MIIRNFSFLVSMLSANNIPLRDIVSANKVVGLLSSHLRKPAIELLTYELIDGFVENDIEADLVFGHGDLPMKLVVTEFVPANRERLYVPAITSKADDQTPFFTNRHPLPVALRGKALVGLVDKCRTHIKYMVANQGDLSGLKPRKMSKLSKRLLGAVGRYHGSIRNVGLHSNFPELS